MSFFKSSFSVDNDCGLAQYKPVFLMKMVETCNDSFSLDPRILLINSPAMLMNLQVKTT